MHDLGVGGHDRRICHIRKPERNAAVGTFSPDADRWSGCSLAFVNDHQRLRGILNPTGHHEAVAVLANVVERADTLKASHGPQGDE